MLDQRLKSFQENPKKSLVKLALPMSLAALIQSLYNLVDGIFVGRLGVEAIASLTFSFSLFFVMIGFVRGVNAGVTSAISRLVGARKFKEANNAAYHGLIISLILAVLFIGGGFFSVKFLLSWMGAEGNILYLSSSYLKILLIGSIFLFPAEALAGIIQGQGDSKTPMKVQVIAVLTNIFLDPIFIYTFKLGVLGAGIATSISFVVSFLLILYYYKKKSIIKITKSIYSKKITKDILKIGASATIGMNVISIQYYFLNKFTATFGANYIGSFGLAGRIQGVVFIPIFAISLALLTMVGIFKGAKRQDLIKEIVKFGLLISFISSILISVVLFLIAPIVFRIFTTNPELILLSGKYLKVLVFALPFVAISIPLARALQGMGYATPHILTTLIRSVLVTIPLAYFTLSFGYMAIPIALVVGGITSAIVSGIYFIVLLKKEQLTS